MTSFLTDNYKKRAEKFDQFRLGYFVNGSHIPRTKEEWGDFNRDTYLSALKSMVEVVEGMKFVSPEPSWRRGTDIEHTDRVLDILKAELERAISEIANNN